MRETLNAVYLVPPGRFPSLLHDPGPWWGQAVRHSGVSLRLVHANTVWWRTITSHSARASAALHAMLDPATFGSAPAYVTAVDDLVAFLEVCNRHVADLDISLARGPRVASLDYSSSGALVEYARSDGALGRSIDAMLDELGLEPDVLLLRASSPEDLLTGLIVADRLKRRCEDLHVSLVDHGYENFTLSPHIEQLRRSAALDRIATTIIESTDDRDSLVLSLLQRLSEGGTCSGYLRRGDLPASPLEKLPCDEPPTADGAVIACSPVFATRLSPRRCYWNRCAFCVQNVKFDDPKTPSTVEIPRAIERLAAQKAAGYRTFYFADEALSPHFLDVLCRGLIDRGIDVRWSCRCKTEASFTPELAARMAEAGCYEVLFGIETVSPRLLEKMDKYVAGMDAEHTRRLLRMLNDAGIGLHINLIVGFPGSTLAEARADVEWTVETAAAMRSVTYTYNTFRLYPGAPMVEDPQRYGIDPVYDQGDMPSSYQFRVDDSLLGDMQALYAEIPALGERLGSGLGWHRLGEGAGARAAVELYQGSGHSCIMKSRDDNPFARPFEIATGTVT